jgi:magnesium chelatase family protein
VRERVQAARARAARRLRGTPWHTNSQVPGPVLRARWPIPGEALAALRRDVDRGALSNRGVDRVLMVAWTLADLSGRDTPSSADVDGARALRLGTETVSLARSAMSECRSEATVPSSTVIGVSALARPSRVQQ